MSPPTEAPRAGGLGVALAATIAIQAFASAAVLLLPAIAPIVAREIGISAHLIGFQVSLIYLLATLASTIAGVLVSKLGPARVSQMALLFSMAGVIGLASGQILPMILASMVMGLGYAGTNPAASDVLNRMTPPHKRNLIFSLKQTGVPIGGMLVALLMPALSLAIGWQSALLVAAAFIGALMLALERVRPGWDAHKAPDLPLRANILEGLQLVTQSPPLLALALMGFLYSAVQLSLVSFVVVMLAQDFGWTPVEAGFAAAAVQATGIGGRIFWGAVADRTHAGLRILSLIGLITASAATTLTLAGGWPRFGVIALLCLFSLSSIGWNGVMMAEAARLSPAGRVGPVAGGVLVLTFLGVVVGPAAFSLLYKLIGSYAHTFGVFALSPLLGAIVIGIGHRLERRRSAGKQRSHVRT